MSRLERPGERDVEDRDAGDRDISERDTGDRIYDAHPAPSRVAKSKPQTAGKQNLIGGFDHAWSGIRLVVGTQRNMKFHVLVAALVIALGIFLGISALEFAVLTLTIAVVFAAEITNTAIEAVVDVASPEHHPLAKTAKDCAAGAVLILSVGAVVVGVLVFYDEVIAFVRGLLSP